MLLNRVQELLSKVLFDILPVREVEPGTARLFLSEELSDQLFIHCTMCSAGHV